MKKTIIALASLALVCACSKQKKDESTEKVVERPEIQVQNGQFTPDVMWALGKMGEYTVSPDGSKLAYTLTYYDMQENKGNAELYVMPTAGGEATRLTVTAQSEFSPVWRDDNTLLFCRGNEMRSIDIDSKAETLVATFENGIEGFKLSPDGKQVVYITDLPVKRAADVEPLFAGLDKTTGRINEDLMYRHWDNWVDEYPQIFLADLDETLDIENSIAIIDSTFECPMRPWGGVEQFNFSPDGKQIVYTCRKKTGKDYAMSTNSDIYLFTIADKSTVNISKGIMGYDQNPVFSHDGTKIAWESMERDGYESDKLRLMVYDVANGTRIDYTDGFDYGVSGITWTDDDKELLAVVMYRGMNEIFAFNVANSSKRQITHGYHDINGFQLCGDKIYANQVSISYPATVYTYNLSDDMKEGTKLTTFNDDILAQVRMGKVEEHWIKSSDGQEMLTWLIYPYDYDSTKVYPALLFCEGGPQTMVSQFWSTRWNFQVMSGAGYFVIAPNRHGAPGFGQAWCAAPASAATASTGSPVITTA